MNISFCTVVLSLIQGIALNTGVLPLAKGGALQCREILARGGWEESGQNLFNSLYLVVL
jgi:hypothetical protein